jgi:hypothetical protein
MSVVPAELALGATTPALFFRGIATKVITTRNIDFDVEKDLHRSVFVK